MSGGVGRTPGRDVDVLVVGSGPAGLSAASGLARHGAKVLVAERELELGGAPRHTDHIGFGMRDLHRLLSGPTYARRLVDRAADAGVELHSATTVLDIEHGAARLHDASGIAHVRARAVVLATGVRERPRAARLVPGDRPAGVLTTGALQQFAMRGERVGRRAVIVGAEHVSFSAVLTLRHVECDVVAMVTPLPRHQTYAPLKWLTANRHRVPVHTGVAIARIVGARRVAAVELTDGRLIECDTVVFTGDWIPDHELARRAGVRIDTRSKGPLTDARFRTTVEGMFAIGNLIHPATTADRCARDGRDVAGAVADWLATGTWPNAPEHAATE